MYINRGVYLSNAILVTKIFCYRYLTINTFAKKYFLRNLLFASAINYKLNAQNCIQTCSYLTFLLYDV